MNEDRTCDNSDANLTQLRSLKVLATDLRRMRPQLSPDLRPHASNIIEQIANIHDESDLERLRPFIRESMERLGGFH